MGRAVVLAMVLLGAQAFAEGAAGETGKEKQPLLTASVTEGASAIPVQGQVEPVYAGTYVYAGSEAERVAVKAAVDRATEGMFGKVIAREVLMERSEIRPSYTIRLDPGRVSVETPGFPPECSPLDGTEVDLRTKYGDVVKNSQQFVSGSLLQQGHTPDGSGSTEFRLLADGNTLRVTCVSRSPRLPRAVEYSLTYVRQQGAR